MAAAELTLTEVNREEGPKFTLLTGTVTVVTTLDWISLSDYGLEGPAVTCRAYTAADGVDGEAFRGTGADADKVFFTQTGAMYVEVKAAGAKSTGGST